MNIELELTNKYLEIEKEINNLSFGQTYLIPGSNEAIRRDSDNIFSYLENAHDQVYYNYLFTNLSINEVMEAVSEIIPDLIECQE